MHCENPGGGGAVGTQIASGVEQTETPYLQARANVFQGVAPPLGESVATGLHPVSVMPTGPTVSDLVPRIPGTGLSVLQIVGSRSKPEKS